MRKILLPLFAVLIITACKKETVSDQPKPQEEIAIAAAAKASDKITIWHYNATNNTWKQTSINANAWSEHQAHGDIWKVGQNYKGGKIGYILQAGDPGYNANVPHGLIAAENDLPYTDSWSFGLTGDGLPEELHQVGQAARGTAIGTGMANTNAMVSYLQTVVNWFHTTYPGSTASASIWAASKCSDLELSGFSDWFLPSIDELQKIMVNRDVIGGFSAPDPIFKTWYWSSTEYGKVDNQYLAAYTCYYNANTPSNAINIEFSYGSNKVRPVRYF